MAGSPGARPVAWSVAGSDSGGGAGLQADLRAFEAMGVHGCTAVAAITAQNSVAVLRVDAVPSDQLEAQLAALASDLPPVAIKTGLLGSVDNVACLARWVDRLRELQAVWLVVDPVWRASTGAELGGEDLRRALLHTLVPRATVLTPNLAEARWLLGDACDAPTAARRLRALGAQAVVVTGGDEGGAFALDWLDSPQASGWLALPRVDSVHHHGSGCVHAATVAAALALDFCAADAVILGKMSTTQGLRHAGPAGRGGGPVRPQAGFALHPGGLPTLHDAAVPPAAPFPTLLQPQMGLYAVVDSAEAVEGVLAAGVRTVQLRIKDGSHRHIGDAVRRSVHAARAALAQLFINDHWQLAIDHGAYGVHLGQEDLAGADMAALRHAGLRVGLSTHSFWEVCRALAWRPSYIACGPIHATTTKAMPWRPQGPANLAYWCQVAGTPVVAIAGMDAERSAEAVRCGAAGVAVLRGIVQAEQPEQAIARLQTAMADARGLPPLRAPALPASTLGAGRRLVHSDTGGLSGSCPTAVMAQVHSAG